MDLSEYFERSNDIGKIPQAIGRCLDLQSKIDDDSMAKMVAYVRSVAVTEVGSKLKHMARKVSLLMVAAVEQAEENRRAIFGKESYVGVIRQRLGDSDYPTENVRWWSRISRMCAMDNLEANEKRDKEYRPGTKVESTLRRWAEAVEVGIPVDDMQGSHEKIDKFIVIIGKIAEAEKTNQIVKIVLAMICDVDLLKGVEEWTWKSVRMIFHALADIIARMELVVKRIRRVYEEQEKLLVLAESGDIVFNKLFNVVSKFWKHKETRKIINMIASATSKVVNSVITRELADQINIEWKEGCNVSHAIIKQLYRDRGQVVRLSKVRKWKGYQMRWIERWRSLLLTIM